MYSVVNNKLTFSIYNYNNEEGIVTIDLPTGNIDNDIESIDVSIESGDEVIDVNMTDGTSQHFDSARLCDNPRITSYFDGMYTVSGELLYDWLDWEKLPGKAIHSSTNSYYRQNLMYDAAERIAKETLEELKEGE